MRICFISSYPPNRARLSEYAYNLITELSKKPGIEKIYVIADKIEGTNKNVSGPGNVSVLRVWKSDNIFSILSVLMLLFKINPDVVHFNVHFQSWGKSRIVNFVGMALIFISKLLGFKVLLE
ncbi:MAG: hypothetical protein GX638_15615, partial [Crenarchaeota archaeon]|nr:hypothetical protein [Thermoproteota archaeon]